MKNKLSALIVAKNTDYSALAAHKKNRPGQVGFLLGALTLERLSRSCGRLQSPCRRWASALGGETAPHSAAW